MNALETALELDNALAGVREAVSDLEAHVEQTAAQIILALGAGDQEAAQAFALELLDRRRGRFEQPAVELVCGCEPSPWSSSSEEVAGNLCMRCRETIRRKDGT